ncbi:hypothetical protein CCMA1212_001654 [Trichoderma ghanense]|uniref:Uncharacterized protein n=1 Tax=Trichoderma ghanense TaxID=65468 RepID=A0ABY2HDU7_9HYPO
MLDMRGRRRHQRQRHRRKEQARRHTPHPGPHTRMQGTGPCSLKDTALEPAAGLRARTGRQRTGNIEAKTKFTDTASHVGRQRSRLRCAAQDPEPLLQ